MGHVFISYGKDDHKTVKSLVDFLGSHGFVAWTDRQGIAAGAAWRKQIVDAIAEADVLILLLSQTSIRSANVRKELDIAEEAQRSVIPVEVETVHIPNDLLYQLAGLQRVRLYADDGYEQLLTALHRLVRSSVVDSSSSETVINLTATGARQLPPEESLHPSVTSTRGRRKLGRAGLSRHWLAIILGVGAATLLVTWIMSQDREVPSIPITNTADTPAASAATTTEGVVQSVAVPATATDTDGTLPSSAPTRDEPEIKQELITIQRTADSDFLRGDEGDEFTFRAVYFYRLTNANARDVRCRVEFTCFKQQRNSTNVLAQYESRTHSVIVKAGASEDLTGSVRCYGYTDDQGQIAVRREVGDCSGT